jgi:hypothetical protein
MREPSKLKCENAWKAIYFAMRVLKKETRIQKCNLHVTGISYYLIWVFKQGSVQGRTDKCARPSTNEISSIYQSYEGFRLGKLGLA